MFFKKHKELQEAKRNLKKELVIARAEIAMLQQLLVMAHKETYKALSENAELQIEINKILES